jgi:probable rRNA maturation factor
MINIQIEHSSIAKANKLSLTYTAELVLTNHFGLRADDYELTILLTDNERIRILNKQFRGIDAPTDVLSFPAEEYDPDIEKTYIGDIIISITSAENHSIIVGHSLENELNLLVVHGVLHLLGFDHDTQTNKKEMWKTQRNLLKQVNSNISRHSE